MALNMILSVPSAIVGGAIGSMQLIVGGAAPSLHGAISCFSALTRWPLARRDRRRAQRRPRVVSGRRDYAGALCGLRRRGRGGTLRRREERLLRERRRGGRADAAKDVIHTSALHTCRIGDQSENRRRRRVYPRCEAAQTRTARMAARVFARRIRGGAAAQVAGVPAAKFDAASAPPPPDYANPDAWSALPGASTDKPADCFYIHPTAYFGEQWNAIVTTTLVPRRRSTSSTSASRRPPSTRAAESLRRATDR